MNGINAFNQKVAENRAQKLFENTVRCWEVRDEDHGGFEEGVLWLGGDFISGDIHDELLESNWCSPSQALVHVYRVICAGIEYLTDKTQRPWRIVCSYGNHGRTTKRPRVSTAAENNLETILYTMLAERYPSVLVPSGALTYLTIQERTVRFHHGDHIRWQGGQSGLEGPINRAVDAWDRIITADLNVIGHWHRAVDFGSTIVNGSLVGYGPYSLKIKAAIEPPQQTFAVITKERGKVDFGRVWVT